MFERFTDSARKVVTGASIKAASGEIEPLHVLLALADVPSLAQEALERLSVTTDSLSEFIPEVPPSSSGSSPRFSNGTKQALQASVRQALQLGSAYVAPEHLLLGLCQVDAKDAFDALATRGVSAKMVVASTLTLLRSAVDEDPDPSQYADPSQHGSTATPARSGMFSRRKSHEKSALGQFGVDLTALAREGKLDPVVARDSEITRSIQVLCRRTKSNPVLVGHPGVGKTAIAEGIAQRIADGEVPDDLKNARLVSLDLASVVAGSKLRGDFEERLKKIIAEASTSKSPPAGQQPAPVILFLDEIHDLVGAGAGSGAMDSANMLKPALSRGELTVIGATTHDEFRKHFQKDAALERRFQPVDVAPPSSSDAVKILASLRPLYQEHHQVKFTDDALRASVEFAARFASDRFLPDSAIDLMDEAGAASAMARRWPNRRVFDQDKLQPAVPPTPTESTSDEAAAAVVGSSPSGPPTVAVATVDVVDRSDVALVCEKQFGVPVKDLLTDEIDRLLLLGEFLSSRVIAQNEAVEVITSAVRRNAVGLSTPARPNGSFLFTGPSGVGKTEMVKSLASFLFDSPDALIALDMSEYQEEHSVSRLLGAPPGYVGHDTPGVLTEQVSRRPFSVVLFDEVEKAHPRVFDTLLQVLEEGRLTDATGRVVDFSNTFIVMTSNLGARDLAKPAVGFSSGSSVSKQDRQATLAKQALAKHFRPEFLNRVDEIVVFSPLSVESVLEIVDLLTERVKDTLKERGVSLSLSLAAKKFLASVGYDETLGARPLRRAIQMFVEDELSSLLLSGQLTAPCEVLVEFDDETAKLVFTVVEQVEVPSSAETSVIV